MSDSEVLPRFSQRLRGSLDAEEAREESSVEAYPSFGWLRGTKDTAPMLELRKKSGTILAVSYGWLEEIEFDPSEGIRFEVGDRRIVIRGQNLNAELRPGVRLFEGITRHRVPWIQEADMATLMDSGPDVCLVETIEW